MAKVNIYRDFTSDYIRIHCSFDFDKLNEAIKWAKKHIKIKEEE